MTIRFAGLVSVGGLLALAGPAWAAGARVAPGERLSLEADLVLDGEDGLEAVGTAQEPCTIAGNGHAIRTGENWKGQLRIAHCRLEGLGSPERKAVLVDAYDGASVTVEDTTFDACGQVRVLAAPEAAVAFRRNVFMATTLVPVVPGSASSSEPAIMFEGGGGMAAKVFQGNKVLKSGVRFEDADGWLIGGDTRAEGNLIVGERAEIYAHGRNVVIRGNYVHATGNLDRWSQVRVLGVRGENTIVEHNVFRGGTHLVQPFIGGELRYNLLVGPIANQFVDVPTEGNAKVHHNVLVRAYGPFLAGYGPAAALRVFGTGSSPSAEFYNNTIDGGDECNRPLGPAVDVPSGAMIASLRSNLFYRIWRGENEAAVGVGPLDMGPGPERMVYADYNAFHTSGGKRTNYHLRVRGKTERTDDGFAKNDPPRGGAVSAQVDSRLNGTVPAMFPFTDEDLQEGKVAVCDILAFYRQIYSPRADSPLVDTGDPADGPGNDIGAVGAGAPHDLDRFGRLCLDPVLLRSVPSEFRRCPAELLRTTRTVPRRRPEEELGSGIVCVCSLGHHPRGGGLAALAVAIGALAFTGAAARRRRRSTRRTQDQFTDAADAP